MLSEREMEMEPRSDLPFKLSAQSKGAQKAFNRFQKQYGTKDAPRIFLGKAEEHGQGSTIRQKVNSIYKKGGKLDGNK